MQIKAMKEVKSCLDGLFVKEVLFTNAVSKEFLEYLSKYGKFEYNYNFPKPLYKLKIDDKLVIKGMVGKTHARISFSKKSNSETSEFLNSLINNYKDKVSLQVV